MVNDKMVNRSVLCILCSVLLLASCNQDDYLGGHYTTEGQGTQARIAAQTAPQQIAVTTSYQDAGSLNRFYDRSEDGTNYIVHTGLPIYIKGEGSLVAYAPVIGIDGEEPAIELDASDQQNIIDYVYATAPVTREQADVQLRFRHIYSRLHTSIKTASTEHIRKVILSGLSQTAIVNPYTWELTSLSAPADYTIVSSTDILAFDLTLIPQVVDSNSVVPAQLVIIGTNRYYEVDLGSITLISDEDPALTIDLTAPVPTVAFSSDGVTWTNYEDKMVNGVGFQTDSVRWTDSGKGGDVTSK